MLSGLLTFFLVVVALVLILLIIALQHGNEGGIGSAFGSGNSAGFFGASGGVSLIIRATWIFGALFFVLAMSLAWVKSNEHFGVGKEIKGLLGDTEAPPAAAATPNAAASVAPGGEVNPVAPAPNAAASSEGSAVTPVAPAASPAAP